MKVKNVFILLAGFCFLSVTSVSSISATDYSHEVKAKKMTFAWKIDGDTLAVKISAETEGWVGIGFNPSQQMKDADFIIGYVKKGKAKIDDEFGVDTAKHSSDEKLGGTADATLVSGTEKDGVTTIEFTIPLKSADKHDAVLDVNGDTVVLLAYGPDRDSFKMKHKYRTSLKVNLSTGASQ